MPAPPARAADEPLRILVEGEPGGGAQGRRRRPGRDAARCTSPHTVTLVSSDPDAARGAARRPRASGPLTPGEMAGAVRRERRGAQALARGGDVRSAAGGLPSRRDVRRDPGHRPRRVRRRRLERRRRALGRRARDRAGARPARARPPLPAPAARPTPCATARAWPSSRQSAGMMALALRRIRSEPSPDPTGTRRRAWRPTPASPWRPTPPRCATTTGCATRIGRIEDVLSRGPVLRTARKVVRRVARREAGLMGLGIRTRLRRLRDGAARRRRVPRGARGDRAAARARGRARARARATAPLARGDRRPLLPPGQRRAHDDRQPRARPGAPGPPLLAVDRRPGAPLRGRPGRRRARPARVVRALRRVGALRASTPGRAPTSSSPPAGRPSRGCACCPAPRRAPTSSRTTSPSSSGPRAQRLWAEDSYRHGLYPITAGPWLAEVMGERVRAAGDLASTWASTPSSTARRRSTRQDDVVLFYARASTPRRAVPDRARGARRAQAPPAADGAVVLRARRGRRASTTPSATSASSRGEDARAPVRRPRRSGSCCR